MRRAIALAVLVAGAAWLHRARTARTRPGTRALPARPSPWRALPVVDHAADNTGTPAAPG